MRSNRAKVLAQIAATMQARHSAAGVIVQNAAKGRIKSMGRIDTGRMLNSVTHEATPQGVRIGSNVEYFPHQELGTVYISPMNSLTDGLVQSYPALRGVYGGLF